MINTTYLERNLNCETTDILDYQEDTTVKEETQVYSIGQEKKTTSKKNVITSTYGKYVYREILLTKALLVEREAEKDKEKRLP